MIELWIIVSNQYRVLGISISTVFPAIFVLVLQFDYNLHFSIDTNL